MRVMIDTTVFLAECLLPDQKYPKVFRKIVSDHTLVFPVKQIEEIRAIMEKFFPEEADTVELFFSGFSYEAVDFKGKRQGGYPFMDEAEKAEVRAVITLDPDMAGETVNGIRFIDPDGFLNGEADE